MYIFNILSSQNVHLFEGLWNLFNAIFSFLVYTDNQGWKFIYYAKNIFQRFPQISSL